MGDLKSLLIVSLPALFVGGIALAIAIVSGCAILLFVFTIAVLTGGKSAFGIIKELPLDASPANMNGNFEKGIKWLNGKAKVTLLFVESQLGILVGILVICLFAT